MGRDVCTSRSVFSSALGSGSGSGRSWTPEDPCCNLAFLSARPHIYKAPRRISCLTSVVNQTYGAPKDVDTKFKCGQVMFRTFGGSTNQQYHDSLCSYYNWMFLVLKSSSRLMLCGFNDELMFMQGATRWNSWQKAAWQTQQCFSLKAADPFL